MFAPAIDQKWFAKLKTNNMTVFTHISKLNVGNTKSLFSKTIPKALRDEGWNATLVIRNHKDKLKYLGFNVEEVAGSLKLLSKPDILWTGYVHHNKKWYAVSMEELVKGRIKHSSRIVLPEIEH